MKEERDDRVVFTAVESRWTWDRLGLMADAEGTQVTAGGADDGPAVALAPGQPRRPSDSTEGLVAGDFLDFCALEGTVGPVRYTFVDIKTNSIVYEATFELVATCA